MKKIIALLCVILTVFCIGCKSQPAEMPPTAAPDTTDTGSIGCSFVDNLIYTKKHLREYTEAHTENLPQNYVGINMLDDFGQFGVYMSGNGRFDSYSYLFWGAGNFYVKLSIIHIDEMSRYYIAEPFPFYYFPSNKCDMHTFSSIFKKDGVYIYKNIAYVYENNRLQSVAWVSDNRYFTLCAGDQKSSLAQYPLDENTFEAKLLNLDTAVAAITERFGEPKNIKELIKQR